MLKNKLKLIIAILCVIMPFTAVADDTSIYGTGSSTVHPNILIILDNSGSMTEQTVQLAYNPATTYTNMGYSTNVVYYYACTTTTVHHRPVTTCTWKQLVSGVSQLNCPQIISDLQTQGYSTNYINTTTYACSSSTLGSNQIELGNYLNYINNPAAQYEAKYIAAKQALSALVTDPANQDKYFGLMMFNPLAAQKVRNGITCYANGGKLVYPCGTATSTINTYVSGLGSSAFSTYTPLAETLAEAGLYFAGKQSWYNTGVTYTSPITEVCQKNYIIIITDGLPTTDNDAYLYTQPYINGLKIGNFDKDSTSTSNPIRDFNSDGSLNYAPSYGTYFLDDVANFLHTQDVRPDMGTGTSFNMQTVTTYTIGLDQDNALLASTAVNGGGKYYTTSSMSGLSQALQDISGAISQSNAIFLAPSIPINSTSKTTQGNWVYLSMFQPRSGNEWWGNLKKFQLGPHGEIYGATSTSLSVVDQYGNIADNACSYWTVNCNDGSNTAKGGAGEALYLRGNARNIYYYTGSNNNLTDVSNAFVAGNTSLPVSDSTVASITTFNNNPNWKLGAIIHSSPAIVPYSTSQSYIYVGANDGMLHCFDDNNGSEVWAFIPPDQATRLSLISSNNLVYYVDASPVITYGTTLMTGTQLYPPEYLIVGERRGGYYYTVLDISLPAVPKFKYQISPSILSAPTGEALGQSWATPVVCNMATAKTTVSGQVVTDPNSLVQTFLIAGGYDTNEDTVTSATNPAPNTADISGRAIFAVDKNTGSLNAPSGAPYNGKALFKAARSLMNTMSNSIVDVRATSTYTASTGVDVTTRIYAGDLGGNVFAFSDDLRAKTVNSVLTLMTRTGDDAPDGTWGTTGIDHGIRKQMFVGTPGHKIFYAPSISQMGSTLTEWVVFGTGDREKPLDTNIVNGIYAIKHSWLDNPYHESDLYDVTHLSNYANKTTIDYNIGQKKGWYIKFQYPGEKLTSPIIIVNDQLYFTTYVPQTSVPVPTDPCAGVGAAGVSYLWAIYLNDGLPVNNTSGPGTPTTVDDGIRRKQVAVMAQPTLSGNLISTPAAVTVPSKSGSDYFFWRQL